MARPNPTAQGIVYYKNSSKQEKGEENEKDLISDTKNKNEDHDSKSSCCFSITSLYSNFTEFLSKISNKLSDTYSILSKGFNALRTKGADQTPDKLGGLENTTDHDHSKQKPSTSIKPLERVVEALEKSERTRSP
jgi:hypothetical protein